VTDSSRRDAATAAIHAGRLPALAGVPVIAPVHRSVIYEFVDADEFGKVMGDAKIERKSGSAKIDVGAEEGLAKRIKFEVRGSDVEFKKVTVTYESGDPEEIDIRDTVRRGGKSRAIDLKGGNRVIKKVIIAFKTDKDADRDARIILMGHK